MSFLTIQEKVRNSILSKDVVLYEVQVDKDERSNMSREELLAALEKLNG